MAYGRVIKMDNGQYKTPNKGRLRDMETGTEYDFIRDEEITTARSQKWDVHKHDIVTFDIERGQATNVELYKNQTDRVVWRYNN